MFLNVAVDSASKTTNFRRKKLKTRKNGRIDHFQPRFSTPSTCERLNFITVSDRAEPGDHFKVLNLKINSGTNRLRTEKLKKSLFDPRNKNVLEHFLNFFLMISRFLSMLYNLVASKVEKTVYLKISKNPLPTLDMTVKKNGTTISPEPFKKRCLINRAR